MDEDRFNMSVRKFLKHVGVTSQRVIEEAVRSGKVEGSVLSQLAEPQSFSTGIRRQGGPILN